MLIEAPFGDIAVHVVQAPRIGLLLSYFAIFIVRAIVGEPRVLGELRRVTAEGIGRGCARAAGIFPFRFGGEAIEVTGLCTEPLTVFICGVLSHADGREAVLAPAETHLDIR